jgi:hypothetical protein
MPNTPLLTTQDAAQYLHVSPRTLEKWRTAGGGPRYRKLVHRVVYTQHDLDTWVDAQTRTSTSDPGPLPLPPHHALPCTRCRPGDGGVWRHTKETHVCLIAQPRLRTIVRRPRCRPS